MASENTLNFGFYSYFVLAISLFRPGFGVVLATVILDEAQACLRAALNLGAAPGGRRTDPGILRSPRHQIVWQSS